MKSTSAWKGALFQGLRSPTTGLDDKRKTWSVCPHLSRPEDLIGHYLNSGPIMVLLGKVLCGECYRIIVSGTDFSGYINVSTYMTDRRFQKDCIDPLIEANRDYLLSLELGQNDDFWICCPHVAQTGAVETLYATCNPLLLREGQVTCASCLDTIPSTSDYIQTLLGCETMTDAQLQEKVIDRLYPVNHQILDSIGQF